MRDGWLILVHKGKHRRLYESHGCTELIFQCNHLDLTTYNQNYEHFFCKMVWNCHFCFMFFMLVSFSFHQHRLSHKTAEEQKVETNRDSNGEDWERKKYFWFHLDNPVMEVCPVWVIGTCWLFGPLAVSQITPATASLALALNGLSENNSGFSGVHVLTHTNLH